MDPAKANSMPTLQENFLAFQSNFFHKKLAMHHAIRIVVGVGGNDANNNNNNNNNKVNHER